MNTTDDYSTLPRSHVIILNGVGSVGKTSTARALQAITAEPFLHVAMDAFIDMVPKDKTGQPEGLVFETVQDAGKPSVIIRTGPVIERAMRGMRHAIAAMAGQGNNLIVDEVMIGKEKEQDYRVLLSQFDVRLVGLFAPLDVLEARERMRGDRMIGLARWQYARVHPGVTYDLEIDTTATTPLENARRIRDAFGLGRNGRHTRQ
ncbi:chloramphenicol phosphotransferase CPT family protein [Acidisphaera sp. S103]|uniref:chloramphenicol phosphotransferase CPT family protein n=1 Tax=Acidisphaera sp. S103 TaxID=1747223 RepID=UPI00131BF290|nr:AAA family ATPase [Acidisphaera sp. S103]